MVPSARRVLAYRPWQFAVNVLAASSLVLPKTRTRLYRWGGLEVETHGIRSRCFVHSGRLRIGPQTLVGQGCHFENREWVCIGSRCSLGPEVMLVTSSHEIGPPHERAGRYAGGPVTIGDGCWIGARATVLPNVTIGDGCVIAAGAVVTGDCAAGGLYAGVPARRIRDLELERLPVVGGLTTW